MFAKKESNKEVAELANKKNQIEQGTKITGNIETLGNIRLDGELVGDLISKSKVVIGPTCVLEGNLTAVTAEIEGTINGAIVVEELVTIKETAQISGNIQAGKIHAFPGAVINGQIKMGAVVKDLQSSSDAKKQTEKAG